MSLFKDDKGSVKPTDKGTSAKTWDAVGSGAGVTSSKIGIETSAPSDAYTQGRGVPGALK